MTSFIYKIALRVLLWVVTRHRLLHLRDWLASVIAIIGISAVGAWPLAVSTIAAIRHGGYEYAFSLSTLGIVLVALLASVPLLYILKLRRLGITDADYSVASGIDYAEALSTVARGFDFAGVGASKLKDKEQDLRDALGRTTKHGGRIRMLLLSPDASKAIKDMEKQDATFAYQEKIEGTRLFLQALAADQPDHMEMRYYSPSDLQSMRPFRLFLTDEDCLLSPFMFGTGVQDQGRGLPQLRITSSGFPRKNLPTLFNSFDRYFDLEWSAANNPEKPL